MDLKELATLLNSVPPPEWEPAGHSLQADVGNKTLLIDKESNTSFYLMVLHKDTFVSVDEASDDV